MTKACVTTLVSATCWRVAREGPRVVISKHCLFSPKVTSSARPRTTSRASVACPASSARRTFTSTSVRYEKEVLTSLPSNPQSHYDFFPQTLSKGPPPAGNFSIDLRSLRREFLQLQAQAHPDLHPPELKVKAEALSSRINDAYKTLQDPLRRAHYILSLNGHGDVEASLEGVGMFGAEEGADKELLMMVMEAREAIEEATSEEDLETIREDNEERIGDSTLILEAAMEKQDWETVKAECVKLKYWMNIKQTILEWEAGKGVPNLQH